MAFFSIHNHTAEGSNLRLRDSINKIPDIIEYAHSLGLSGICFTEHESITSHLDALKYWDSRREEADWQGFKIGLGNEIYLCSKETKQGNPNNKFPHFVLLALNAHGHKGIRELSTKAWMNNSFMNVMMRVPTYYNDLEEMMANYKGDIVASTACLGGYVPMVLLMKDSSSMENCVQWIEYMNDIFGKGNFFLEMQPSDGEEQVYVNGKLLELSVLTDTPYIITTDAHYLKKEDRPIHKAYLNAQEGDREVDEFYATTYVMSPDEIHEYMDPYLGYEAVQRGLNNTQLIYDRVEYYQLTKPLEIPYLPLNETEPSETLYHKYEEDIPLLSEFYYSETNSDRHLVRDIVNKLEVDESYRCKRGYDAIQECLESIKVSSAKLNVHWSAYLEQIATDVQIAWDAGSLVGAARGSGGGFCLLNILDIIQINPLKEKTKMYPWRFLNPERASVLDIDIDIEGSKRDVVVQAMKNIYGEDRISKVMTLSTEKSKAAILTAARGLGIDTDIAQYISSLVVYDRGVPRTLAQMYYGDEDNPPVTEFVNEMNKLPELWEMAQKIEGLVCGVGSHAGGIILVDKPFTETTALMKTNSGEVITQFDLHMCEDCSLIKKDILCIDALDKLHVALDLLLADHVIEWQGSLKATYEKYLGVYTLERADKKMWEMLWQHKVISFFQMEKESGKQAIALARPESVDDLAALNSAMRLMAQEAGAETPLEKFARFKNDISLWYKEMDDYGLTKEEQHLLEPILKESYGICIQQEHVMMLVQIPEIGGYSLAWADKLRKSIAKKNPKAFLELEKEYYQHAEEQHLSFPLIDYVWRVLIYTQKSYGFNAAHCLSYSIIGLQELNLNYKYNPIYWQTANLVVDSGAVDESSNDGTNYGKMALAIATAQSQGVNVALPLVNSAGFGFTPDVENNRIIFGLKGVNGLGTDVVKAIIENRPYSNMEDFYERMYGKVIKPAQMIAMIKAGCFTELDGSREDTMFVYLQQLMKPVNKLTLAQFDRLVEFDEKYHFIPEQVQESIKHKYFKDYVLQDKFLYRRYVDPLKKKVPKAGYHDRWYKLDNYSMQFFQRFYTETAVEAVEGESYIISEKKFLKENDTHLEMLRKWMAMEEHVTTYNQCLLSELWEQYAAGSESKWEMDSLSIYCTTEHELAGLDRATLGVVNYFDEPEEPEYYGSYWRTIKHPDGTSERKEFPKNKIVRIAGTVLDKNANRHTVTLLTVEGVVLVKLNKGQFAFYDRKLDGEKSWFTRGNKLLVCGCRMGDQFMAKKYADTVWKHTVNLITSVEPLSVKLERGEQSGR